MTSCSCPVHLTIAVGEIKKKKLMTDRFVQGRNNHKSQFKHGLPA